MPRKPYTDPGMVCTLRSFVTLVLVGMLFAITFGICALGAAMSMGASGVDQLMLFLVVAFVVTAACLALCVLLGGRR